VVPHPAGEEDAGEGVAEEDGGEEAVSPVSGFDTALESRESTAEGNPKVGNAGTFAVRGLCCCNSRWFRRRSLGPKDARNYESGDDRKNEGGREKN
jgi:hypothetical protein